MVWRDLGPTLAAQHTAEPDCPTWHRTVIDFHKTYKIQTWPGGALNKTANTWKSCPVSSLTYLLPIALVPAVESMSICWADGTHARTHTHFHFADNYRHLTIWLYSDLDHRVLASESICLQASVMIVDWTVLSPLRNLRYWRAGENQVGEVGESSSRGKWPSSAPR